MLTKSEYVINNTQDFPAMLNIVPTSEDMKKMLVMTLSHYLQISLSKKQ